MTDSYASPLPPNIRDAQQRAVDVILDHLDPPSPRLGRNDWCMNVEKIVRALSERGLLAHAARDAQQRAEALREAADKLAGEVKSMGSSGDLFTDETWKNGAMHVVVRMRSEADRIADTNQEGSRG